MNKLDGLIVNECFLSLQGESTQAGRLCYFIRLTGCNLNCNYCDTTYAADGSAMSVEQLVQLAEHSGAGLVEITGGEPLAQAATPLLARKLLDAGLDVMVETNGSRDISVFPDGVRRIVDCKLPGSGEYASNLWSNFEKLGELDEVKFVISDFNDFNCALEIVEKYKLAGQCPVLYSPVWGRVGFDELAGWIIAAKAPGRMQLQLHKLIWGADAVGV